MKIKVCLTATLSLCEQALLLSFKNIVMTYSLDWGEYTIYAKWSIQY